MVGLFNMLVDEKATKDTKYLLSTVDTVMFSNYCLFNVAMPTFLSTEA